MSFILRDRIPPLSWSLDCGWGMFFVVVEKLAFWMSSIWHLLHFVTVKPYWSEFLLLEAFVHPLDKGSSANDNYHYNVMKVIACTKNCLRNSHPIWIHVLREISCSCRCHWRQEKKTVKRRASRFIWFQLPSMHCLSSHN